MTEERTVDNRPFIERALESFTDNPAHNHLRTMLAGYSPNGQITMVSFLMYAREDGVLDRAIEVLDQADQENFRFQHPEMRGNPDISIPNATRLGIMMSDAGVMWPRSQPAAAK